MSNEIKQGDRVRVSKDIPQFYRRYNSYRVFEVEHQVVDIEDGIALLDSIPSKYVTTIPCKYLVKVDAEEKEAKIKLGDMVRVKGNLHEPFCLDADLHLEVTNMPPRAVSQKEWKVIKVENRRDCAEHIYTLNNGDSFIYNIPEDCIELVEPTAPKIKVGDRVRNVKSDLCGIALKIEHGIVEVGIPYDKERHYWNTDIVELFEPTEQTEEEEDARIRQMEAELDEFRIAELDRMLHPEKYYTYEVTIDNVAMNWQRYEADLAKELALKVANKFNDPKEAAEYSVLVAKAVVEGLKRK